MGWNRSPLVIACTLATLVPLFCTSAQAQHDTRKAQPGNGPTGSPETVFLSHRLGTDHAEGISALDVNGDGFLDLLSGAYWYENPGAQGGTWKQHQWRTVPVHGEFVSDCGEWTIDVNHDGHPDVVTAGWITNGAWWFENPGPAGAASGAMWKKHFIGDSFDTEGGAIGDINGDGKPDVALAHYNRSGLSWIDFSGPQPKVHVLAPKEADGHGVGIADIDGDGKADLLTPFGWFRNVDANADKWEWHPDWQLGDAGFPILGYDVDGDGRADLIVGQGHGYGLYWWQQGGPKDKPTWTRHVIDESFSQSHALKLVDLDGDGVPELVTGKRYRGHSGNDPGSYDPVVLFYYKLDRKTATWTRHAISVNGTAGVGTQILAEDLDHDGDIDLAVAGKLGVHVLENLRVNNVPKATREAQQPIERTWPFPGEGVEAQQENGPADRHVNDAVIPPTQPER
ncbi:FG-GAP repeat domain-containing protein [Terriglobus sp.]|uniref:FG-GAP repeat domain-containing protein n=1 Tax=Terriglobus sp. TaxID=1889013 RepID=UPI003B005E86